MAARLLIRAGAMVLLTQVNCIARRFDQRNDGGENARLKLGPNVPNLR
jgi:hypothetical protein